MRPENFKVGDILIAIDECIMMGLPALIVGKEYPIIDVYHNSYDVIDPDELVFKESVAIENRYVKIIILSEFKAHHGFRLEEINNYFKIK